MVRNELFHKNINVGLWLGPKGVKLLNPYFQSTVIENLKQKTNLKNVTVQ